MVTSTTQQVAVIGAGIAGAASAPVRADWWGRPVDWQHCAVQRWRYALRQTQSVVLAEPCGWDADQGLRVCGDFLGGCGVGGAWLSAQSLASALLRRASEAADAFSAFADHEAAHETAHETAHQATHHAARRLIA